MKRMFCLSILVGLLGCTVQKAVQSANPYTGDVIGCGTFTAYKLTDDQTSFIAVRVDLSKIVLVEKQVYELSMVDFIYVSSESFEQPIAHTLCNDLMPAASPKSIEKNLAKRGTLAIEIAAEELTKYENGQSFSVNLTLKSLDMGESMIDYLLIENVRVGWMPG